MSITTVVVLSAASAFCGFMALLFLNAAGFMSDDPRRALDVRKALIYSVCWFLAAGMLFTTAFRGGL